ncbi:MAG: helix-turn-helix transcriptional regulator [Alphaproteobacteria bacterium]|nr:helix-turn-helix transcriptional regulator [Alphaproteobacteria bacterium]
MARKRRSAVDDLERLDAVFAALSHASRRQVLQLLHLRGGSMTSREIADRFECEWATMSRHFKVLVDAGLIKVVKRGRQRVYRIDRAAIGGPIARWMKWVT